MDRKHATFCSDLYANINKYNIEIEKYLLPFLPFPNRNEKIKETEPESGSEPEIRKPIRLIETLKKKYVDLAPTAGVWQFVSKADVEVLRQTNDRKIMIKLIEGKLKNFKIRGLPKKLTVEMFLSVVLFAKEKEFTGKQMGALLSMFYNTHSFFLLDLWKTPEQVFKYFKEILFVYCIELDPIHTCVFTGPEVKRIVFYFHTIYTRNMPLIRLMMLPHYGLTICTKDNPIPEELLVALKPKKKKGKK